MFALKRIGNEFENQWISDYLLYNNMSGLWLDGLSTRSHNLGFADLDIALASKNMDIH
jgi:hypothetical protein